MASFKKVVDVNLVEIKYEGGIKVYLESAEDVRIFKDHWFSDKLDKLNFISAENQQSGGGGCNVVIDKVNKINDAIQNNKTAYGIVDRDILLSHGMLDLFWETDDHRFRQAFPFGQEIHVLGKWELENYLLQPSAFDDEVKRRASRAPATSISVNDFLAQANDIIEVTALTTCLVSNGEKSPNPGYGMDIAEGQTLQLKEKVEKHVENHLNGKLQNPLKDLEQHRTQIRAFDPQTEIAEDRWDSLTRILDGKKALKRLCKRVTKISGINGISNWEEIRGCLASNIASQGTVDKELLEFIDSIAS